MSGNKQGGRPIIIKKEEVVEGGHHGGAWKVAYADFVTAMMAFFLLMWLLNATSQEQKRGLADYFSPNSHLSRTTSGMGLPFGGRSPNSDGALPSDQGAVQLTRTQPYPWVDADDDTGEIPSQFTPSPVPGTAQMPSDRDPETPSLPLPPQSGTETAPGSPPATASAPVPGKPTEKELQREIERREKREFERTAQQMREAVASDPALADLAKQLAIDITPEGLRIQILDADRTPMFPTGSAALNDRARAMLAKIAPMLLHLPEAIAISGHTDATPYRGGERSNWDLSAERANTTRRLLVDAGLPEARLRSVTGHADRDPLVVADPMAAANRRIAIVLLRERAAAAR